MNSINLKFKVQFRDLNKAFHNWSLVRASLELKLV